MSSSVTLEAPGKLNLGLRVVGRRDDGYHLLESLFVPISLSDELTLDFDSGGEPGVELTLVGASEGVPADASNLVVAAAEAFFGGAPAGALRIHLHKQIPAAAGLGGGSSDAAAVLRGLSELVPGGPAGEALGRLALSLGADVPFFLDPRPALVRGIGETIEPFTGLPELWALLANPGMALPTGEVFRLHDSLKPSSEAVPAGLTPPEPGSTMRALSGLPQALSGLPQALSGSPQALSGSPQALSVPEALSGLGGDAEALARLPGFTNDLEAAAIRLCPPVARLRDRMRELGARVAGMSGSGATVYGLFGSQSEAEHALESAAFEAPTWSRVTRVLV